MAEPKMKIKRDYSDKSDAALRKMLEKDSGASVADVKAAYNELSKRKGDLGFTVTMVLGGRELGKDEIVMPTKKPKMKNKKAEMAYGGMAGGKKHMYAAGGMVKDNPGLKALKKASPEAYKKITGK